MTTAIANGFAVFETTIGCCGIAWSDRGVLSVQLPEASQAQTLARLRQRFPDANQLAPPQAVQSAIAGIVSLLRGEASDLSAVALDMQGVPDFHRRVYEAARSIPAGSTLTYGEIAKQLGNRGLSREVGQALGRNPFAIIVPCHRVLAAGGRTGGFSAGGGVSTKLRLLKIERAKSVTLDLFSG